MKKVIFFMGLFILGLSLSAAPKVVIATGEWEPYTSEKMSGKGFCTEIVTAVFSELGIEVEYVFVPWKRAEDMALKGEAFAAFPYVTTEERKKSFDFSDPFAKSTAKFFYIKNGKVPKDFKWTTYSDLKPFRVGGSLGYWYEKPFKDAGLNLDMAPNDESTFKKLAAGRVDITVTAELVGWQIIKNLFPKEMDKFDTIDKPLSEDELCLMVSRTYPDSKGLTEKFNAGLKKIKEKGTYGALLKKYNIK